MPERYISQLHGNAHKKAGKWKYSRTKFEQDWYKICWRGIENDLGHRQCFFLGFLVFSILFFSTYGNLKSNGHLLFLAIFPDLKIIQFWSVNNICHACKLYFLFWTCPRFWKMLILELLNLHFIYTISEQWLIYFWSLVNIYCNPCTQNCILLYSLEAKNPCSVRKIVGNCSYVCVFVLPKKQHVWE